MPDALRTVLLAGGRGSRLAEETDLRPKPMVDVGGRPLLWHIMQGYAAYGHSEFVVAVGYLGEVVKSYFLNYASLAGDLSVDLATGVVEVHGGGRPSWKVHVVDTGLDTQTGGRLKRLRSWVSGGTFMMTYGDGLSDVDIGRLIAFHRSHGRLATVTAVRPPARFGGLHFEGDRVVFFEEKPQSGEGWINGGFFVLEPGVLDYIDGDPTPWEKGPLDRLAADGQLMAFRHEGWWQPVDTLRDKRTIQALWDAGEAPWMKR
jgi:glucose-1-phosphate cytidylyltransferase